MMRFFHKVKDLYSFIKRHPFFSAILAIISCVVAFNGFVTQLRDAKDNKEFLSEEIESAIYNPKFTLNIFRNGFEGDIGLIIFDNNGNERSCKLDKTKKDEVSAECVDFKDGEKIFYKMVVVECPDEEKKEGTVGNYNEYLMQGCN